MLARKEAYRDYAEDYQIPNTKGHISYSNQAAYKPSYASSSERISDICPTNQPYPKAAAKEEIVPQTKPLLVTELDLALRSKLRTVFLLIAALAMVVTIMSGIGAKHGYALVETQRQTRELEEENERLKIEIAKLKAPNRIQTIAIEKLGMQMPAVTYFSHEGE